MIKTKHDLLNFMGAGATVITPNNRLSNQLLHDFYLQQNSLIKDKPHCLPYQAFLRDLYTKVRHLHAHTNHPVLLNSLQQRHLWRKIITSQDSFPCNEGLLHEVQDAWTRCQHWQIDMDSPEFSHTPQTRQFQQWQKQLQQNLTSLGAITEEQLVFQILSYQKEITSATPVVLAKVGIHPQSSIEVQSGINSRLLGKDNLFSEAHSTIIWVCFDDYTPQQRTLQQTFDAQGCQQYYYDLEEQPTNTQCYAAHDRQDECMQLIDWLKCRISAGDQRIGVVVPDLQAQYLSLQRLLQRHIPQDQFNISLGKPLTDYPLVTHALTWLSLDKGTVSNHEARLLLHSPYLFGAKTEFPARSQAMHNSKILQEANIPFDNLLHELSTTTPKLSRLLKNIEDYPEHATPQTWMNHFKARLITLGFPGEYPLDSPTYQCFQRFMGLFDEIPQLSVITPLLSAQAALEALYDLAQSTIFQTRKSTTPIQVLGLLEASGCTFDSIWVSGLTDQCLPQKTRLSAFIPLNMQSERNMPRAVAARELQFAQQLLQRLQRGSKQSIFSYPQLSGDMPNLPSPLIVDLPSFTPALLDPVSANTLLVRQKDDYSLPLKTFETASGGTSLLANQAKCPFRAFAAHRLHATPEPKLSTGPDASERGQILHRIMELLWHQIGSQQHLNSMTSEELDTLIDSAIHNALGPHIQNRQHSFSPLVQDVELSRLRRLVNACLDWDRQRPAFVVEALEKTYTINLGGIDFRVRIDRMDKLASDKKWVIDYKTSIPTIKPWAEERPESPQLLLYALLDEAINALLFIQLKAGRLTCTGLSEDAFPVKGINGLKKNETWSDHKQQWHQKLTDLATEFAAGFCPPQPSRSSTCEQCDFQNICRI